MKKINHALILFFSLISFFGFCQKKEYLITKTNDTIYGKIMRRSNFFYPEKIQFVIKDEEKNKTKINPNTTKLIRSFKGADGDSKIIPLQDCYVAEILTGRINVYKILDGTFMYVSKDNSKILPTTVGGLYSRKIGHSQIRLLIKDNKEILKEFDSLSGSYKNVLYIIRKYNIYNSN